MNGTNAARKSSQAATRIGGGAGGMVRTSVVNDIATARVSVTGGTQMRTCLNDEIVRQYADRMAAGDVFPPIIVFQDGTRFWLADGFHRLRARELVRASAIQAEIYDGDLSDAIEYAVGANTRHGLRRTNGDKRMAVRAALAHERLRELSDRQIADLAGVDHKTVGAMRRGETVPVGNFPSYPQVSEETGTPAARVGADGKTRRLPRNGQLAAKRPASRSGAAPIRSRASGKGAVCPHCQGTGRLKGDKTL